MTDKRKILFFDFSSVNKIIEDKIKRNLNKLLSFKTSKEYKEYVALFEEQFAKYCECKGCMAVNSGTSALQLALLSLGIKKNNEVIVPAYTYAASAIAVSNIGAKPVFVDVNDTDLTIDASKIEEKINSKTKAVIAVHIHGNLCDLEMIMNICKKHDLKLIEDASQAHGARFAGQRTGSFGVSCFSFHMSKSLGAFSSAGAITFNDISLKEKIRNYVFPDNDKKEVINSGRTPCDMDALHACFLIPKLQILDKLNKRKNEVAALYDSLIVNSMFAKPKLNKKGQNVYRDYFIQCKNREKVMKVLSKEGIETKARYKIALHLTKTFEYLVYKDGDFPVAERAAKEVLCLPTHMGISDDDIKYICSALNKVK